MSLEQCLNAIDDINAQDPKQETNEDGLVLGACLLYGQRMSEMLSDFYSDASEVLQIAVRAQHIQRWHIPRSDYPTGREAYLRWRRALAVHHAELCAQIMKDLGYSDEDCEKAKSILQKKRLKQDPDSQALEDVACLVFLRYYFASFASAHSEEKIISIVQKTWKKMSTNAQEKALTLALAERELTLIKKALA